MNIEQIKSDICSIVLDKLKSALDHLSQQQLCDNIKHILNTDEDIEKLFNPIVVQIIDRDMHQKEELQTDKQNDKDDITPLDNIIEQQEEIIVERIV